MDAEVQLLKKIQIQNIMKKESLAPIVIIVEIQNKKRNLILDNSKLIMLKENKKITLSKQLL